MLYRDKARRLANFSSRIARLQKLIAERPEDEKLIIALAGLAKRADAAREAFSELAQDNSFEVLDYRISQSDSFYPLKSVTDSLNFFQQSITSIHDATTTGPKQKARFSAEIEAQTTLNFELFYPGSKGFLLSVPSEENLFGGTLDETASALNDYLDINNYDGARDASRTLGLAAISTLFKWVSANSKWGNTIDYEWRARKFKTSGRHVPVEHFRLLEDVFRGAEDRQVETVEKSGILVGLDISRRTFNFVEPDGDSYKGRLHSDYPGGEKTIPHRYIAKLVQVTITRPATGEVKTNYELVELI